MVNVVMGFFTRILYGLTEFVRRNPVTCLVILILAVAAPSVLVGIANFIFYVMLTILLLGVVFVLLFRYRVNKLRREMGQQGGFSPLRTLAGRFRPAAAPSSTAARRTAANRIFCCLFIRVTAFCVLPGRIC